MYLNSPFVQTSALLTRLILLREMIDQELKNFDDSFFDHWIRFKGDDIFTLRNIFLSQCFII